MALHATTILADSLIKLPKHTPSKFRDRCNLFDRLHPTRLENFLQQLQRVFRAPGRVAPSLEEADLFQFGGHFMVGSVFTEELQVPVARSTPNICSRNGTIGGCALLPNKVLADAFYEIEGI